MRRVTWFLGGFFASIVGLSAERLDAAWQRVAAVGSCYPDEVVTGQQAFTAPRGISNLSSSSYLPVQCDVDESDVFVRQNVNVLTVYGEDLNSTDRVTAGACIAYRDTDGGECGSPAATTNAFVGSYTLNPPLSKWSTASANDFAYLTVGLGKSVGSAYSSLRGFYIATP